MRIVNILLITFLKARRHVVVDTAFSWKVLLSKIIWRLQVQYQQQVGKTKEC